MSVSVSPLAHDMERDFVNCFEFQFWYMVRQSGLYSYIPILNTKSFYSSGNVYDFIKNYFDNNSEITEYFSNNINCIKVNLETYFNAKFKNYSPNHYINFYTFVKEAIDQNRAVFAFYDNYYNTIENEKYYLRQHNYHGTVILGYDDINKIYMTNKSNINYDDMEKMVKHCLNKFDDIGLNTYILTWNKDNKKKENIQTILQKDLNRIIDEWHGEIRLLGECNEDILKMKNDEIESIMIKLMYLRTFFISASTGIHGNLLLKVRLIEELFRNDLDEFYNKFVKNRQQALIIANMIGKASIQLKVDLVEGLETIKRASSKINKYFIEESTLLLEEFKEIIKEI